MDFNPIQSLKQMKDGHSFLKSVDDYPELKHILKNYDEIPNLGEILHPIEDAPESIKAVLRTLDGDSELQKILKRTEE